MLRGLLHDGFYVIPNPLTAADVTGILPGPTAFVRSHLGARPVFKPLTLAKGFGHYLTVAALLGLVLGGVPRGGRTRVALGIAALAVGFIHLAGPIWWNYNWENRGFLSGRRLRQHRRGGLVMAYSLRWLT